MEAHKLRMGRLNSMIDDHKKALANLKNRVVEIGKVGGGSIGISTLKADLDVLKKEVASFQSTNLSTFFDRLEDPPLKVDVAIIPDEGLIVDLLGDGSEENQEVSTPDIDEEALGAEYRNKDQEEVDGVENGIVKVVKVETILDQSMIGTSGLSEPKPARPVINLKSIS